MITDEMAKMEIAVGMSAVCAWCEHWHNAKLRGERVKCGLPCGGPVSGKSFPMYKGPMAGKLHMMCFICGEEAEVGLNWKGGFIGVCNRMGPMGETHLDKFKRMISGASQKIVAKEITVPVVGDTR